MSTQLVKGEHQAFDAQEATKRLEPQAGVEGRVIFLCPSAERLLFNIVRAKKFVIDGQVIDQEQRNVQFTEHTYISDDPVEIDLIRKHRVYKTGDVVELSKVAHAAREKRVADVLAQLDDPMVKAAVADRLSLGKANVPTVKDVGPKK